MGNCGHDPLSLLVHRHPARREIAVARNSYPRRFTALCVVPPRRALPVHRQSPLSPGAAGYSAGLALSWASGDIGTSDNERISVSGDRDSRYVGRAIGNQVTEASVHVIWVRCANAMASAREAAPNLV